MYGFVRVFGGGGTDVGMPVCLTACSGQESGATPGACKRVRVALLHGVLVILWVQSFRLPSTLVGHHPSEGFSQCSP